MASYSNDDVNATPPPQFGEVSHSSSAPSPSNSSHPPGDVGIAPGARPWRVHRRFPPSRPNGRPDETTLAADRKRIKLALTVTLGLLILVWGAFFIDLQFDLEWRRFGNRPLRWNGLVGIFSMPFLHGDFKHLWGNTVSFFTLCAMLIYFYRGVGLKVLAWTWFGAGVLLWLSGAPGNHIGLSGVVYALASFLFLSGLIRMHPHLIRVAMVVAFLYGSIVWGVFPIETGVSWQGHLSGAALGGLLAIVWRKQGPQRPPIPVDEEEDEELHSDSPQVS